MFSVIDLKRWKNWNRSNNLQLVRIPEGHEDGDIVKFIGCILKSVLGGDDATKLPDIESAHQAPIPWPNPGDKPRTILVWFLCSSNRELVLQAARSKGELIWEGNEL
ncbi:hypothetical protein LDENG_00142910 [Lucifuga dentata]|nr:hypothetical protein LDENG_00142910 [Lucifuga dentata]